MKLIKKKTVGPRGFAKSLYATKDTYVFTGLSIMVDDKSFCAETLVGSPKALAKYILDVEKFLAGKLKRKLK